MPRPVVPRGRDMGACPKGSPCAAQEGHLGSSDPKCCAVAPTLSDPPSCCRAGVRGSSVCL